MNTENNVDHFCLQIKPVSENEIIKYLKYFDIEISEFVKRYGAQGLGNSIYIKDPEGNTVEIKNQI